MCKDGSCGHFTQEAAEPSPAVEAFADALMDAYIAAVKAGCDANDIYGTLARFAGFTMASSPQNTVPSIAKAMQSFMDIMGGSASQRIMEVQGPDKVMDQILAHVTGGKGLGNG